MTQKYNAVIVNIDPYDIQSKLSTVGGEQINSVVDSVQRLDIEKGYHFIQPIYISSKFHLLFEKLSHLTVDGISLLEQGVFLILKRGNAVNSVILSHGETTILELSMTLEQLSSMSKVLHAGGMRKIRYIKKSSIIYYLNSLQITCYIHTISHLPAFLEVQGQTEIQVLDGLAIFGISANRAVLETPFETVLTKYRLRTSQDLLRFIV